MFAASWRGWLDHLGPFGFAVIVFVDYAAAFNESGFVDADLLLFITLWAVYEESSF
jgi:hypothetical protein